MQQDIPNHFGIAEGWTIADMYSQAVVASTIPNRGMYDAFVPHVVMVIVSHRSVLG